MRHLLFLIGFLFLTACARGTVDSQSEFIHGIAPEDLSARIELKVLERQGQLSTVAIVLLNPQSVPVQSIRSWVQYDPLTVRVKDLGIVDNRFSLFAPGERMIDPQEGLIKLGAATREPVKDTKIVFATFTAQSSANKNVILSFYNWRDDGEGHTAALTLKENEVLNVLAAPSSFSL